MAATFTWTAINTTGGENEIGATDVVGFYGSSFNDAIATGEYQDSTHRENDSNVEQCTVTHLNNTKWLSSSTVSLNGAGSANVNTITSGNCPVLINFTYDSAVATSDTTFWADDGLSTTSGPGSGSVMFYAAATGDASWSQCSGSSTNLSLDADSAATSHDYFIFMSASPLDVGVHDDFRLQIQLTYQ